MAPFSQELEPPRFPGRFIYAITPSLSIGSEPLVLTLRHRYDFEYGNSNGRAYDGGLLQVSKDDGQSWSGIDSSVLGSVQPLSDCCGNPMAGKPAFFAKSTEFPEFFIQTINFGTTYAGTAKLRFRFAIATDESITGSGWDIDSLGVSGATNTPFTDIVRSACASLAGRPLQGAMSGTYYTSTRSGEGVMVDIGLVASRPTVLLGWYTYDAGEQRWLFGTQQFDKGQTQVTIPLVQTEGASFGMAFKPQDVTSIPWGSVALRFDDCDSMTLIYDKTGGEKGTLQLQRGLARLSPNQCNQLPQGLSGTFYSPDRPGEGVMIGFGLAGNTPTEVFGWYTYEAGKQAWLFGTRPWTGAKGPLDIDLIRTEGANFGSGFRPEDVRILPWGKVTQFFQGCNTLRLDYAKTAGDSGTLLLERGLERLDEGVCE